MFDQLREWSDQRIARRSFLKTMGALAAIAMLPPDLQEVFERETYRPRLFPGTDILIMERRLYGGVPAYGMKGFSLTVMDGSISAGNASFLVRGLKWPNLNRDVTVHGTACWIRPSGELYFTVLERPPVEDMAPDSVTAQEILRRLGSVSP